MKRNDILVGATILIVIIAGVFILRSSNSANETPPVESPSVSAEEQIESTFKIDIPEDADKADLVDQSETNSIGVATRQLSDNSSVVTVLADLPAPETGEVYQASIAKEDSQDAERVNLGNLRQAKGGWMTDYRTSSNIQDYKVVFVTRVGGNSSQVMLKGNFN